MTKQITKEDLLKEINIIIEEEIFADFWSGLNIIEITGKEKASERIKRLLNIFEIKGDK